MPAELARHRGDGGLRARRLTTPTVALTLWGDVLEDYLDTIGVSFDAFCTEVSGTWLFGYIEALDRVGIRAVLVVWSRAARRPHRRVHVPTGTAVWVLPPTRIHRAGRALRRAAGRALRQIGVRLDGGGNSLAAGLNHPRPQP